MDDPKPMMWLFWGGGWALITFVFDLAFESVSQGIYFIGYNNKKWITFLSMGVKWIKKRNLIYQLYGHIAVMSRISLFFQKQISVFMVCKRVI